MLQLSDKDFTKLVLAGTAELLKASSAGSLSSSLLTVIIHKELRSV